MRPNEGEEDKTLSSENIEVHSLERSVRFDAKYGRVGYEARLVEIAETDSANEPMDGAVFDSS